MTEAVFDNIVEAATRRYAPMGRFEAGWARGKMRADPIFRALLDRGLAEARSVTDLGCGRGYLLTLLLETRGGSESARLAGVELAPRAVEVARRACGDGARIEEADLAEASPAPADAVALIDVLHYLPLEAQDRLLEIVARSLPPAGRLYVREADAGRGAAFQAVRLTERLRALGRGEGFRPFRYRRAADLSRRLESLGLAVSVHPMGAGTPFANVLLEARSAP